MRVDGEKVGSAEGNGEDNDIELRVGGSLSLLSYNASLIIQITGWGHRLKSLPNCDRYHCVLLIKLTVVYHMV